MIGLLPPPWRAICELNGESPCFGSSTTTTVPSPTRSIQIDHVLIGHADAAGRDRCADIFRLVGAVNSEQRVLAAGIEVKRPGTHRIIGTGRHEFRYAEPRDFPRGRMPGRPFGFAANLGDTGPCHGFFADGDAVSDRLAAVEHVVEIVIVGIDYDRARLLPCGGSRRWRGGTARRRRLWYS